MFQSLNRSMTQASVLLLATLATAGLAHASTWNQGFETSDSPGAPGFGWDTHPYSYVFNGQATPGPVSQVSSALNVTGSAVNPTGSFMAAFGTTPNTVQVSPLGPFPAVAHVGPATSFNDAFSGTWPTVLPGIRSSIDVYLDTGWKDGSGFDYSIAISQAGGDPGVHRRDFMFHVYKGVDAASNKIYVDTSSNTQYRPLDVSTTGFEITTSGWYRLDYSFNELNESAQTQGYLGVTMALEPGGGGSALQTWTLSNPTDIIDSDGSGGVQNRTVGGRNYGWLPFIDLADPAGTALPLYVDNVYFSNPEPTSLSLLALGALALLPRRRRNP